MVFTLRDNSEDNYGGYSVNMQVLGGLVPIFGFIMFTFPMICMAYDYWVDPAVFIDEAIYMWDEKQDEKNPLQKPDDEA